jgi:mono/diheme cytochrome c family protein
MIAMTRPTIRAIVAGTVLLMAVVVAGAAPPRDGAVELGEVAFKTSGCFNCHTIGKVGTPLGPDLSHVGTRYPAEYMARWLRDPALQRPNAHMPAFELTEAQVRALAAYLASLE